MVTRREFLTGIGSLVTGLVIGGGLGYSLSPKIEVTKTETETKTKTITEKVSEGKKIKAAWIYVGPIGDYGWTHAHHKGKEYVDNLFPWLETIHYESVKEEEVSGVIEQAISEGAKVIFTTSFGYMDPTLEAAKRHPDIIFEHCSGYKRWENMGTYFAEFYQLYYLNGLIAGAMTKTNKIGYVAAHLIPEVVRHINAFVLGAREVNPKIKAFIIEIGAWFDPPKAEQAATALIETHDVDVLAFTEDSPTVLKVAERYQEQGKKVWSFSHYSPMQEYGPKAHLTGQLVNWGVIYEYILARVYAGNWISEDIWWRLGDGTPFRWARKPEESTAGQKEGAVYLAPINPVVPKDIINLVKLRYEQMKELLFEPFTGPIYDNEGNLRVKKGERLGHNELWNMDWFVEGIERTSL